MLNLERITHWMQFQPVLFADCIGNVLCKSLHEWSKNKYRGWLQGMLIVD